MQIILYTINYHTGKSFMVMPLVSCVFFLWSLYGSFVRHKLVWPVNAFIGTLYAHLMFFVFSHHGVLGNSSFCHQGILWNSSLLSILPYNSWLHIFPKLKIFRISGFHAVFQVLLISTVADILTFFTTFLLLFFSDTLKISLRAPVSNGFVSYLKNGALWFKCLKVWNLVQFFQCMRIQKRNHGLQNFHNLRHTVFQCIAQDWGF